MSKIKPIPENVSKCMRKFYTSHETCTDPSKLLEDYLNFLVDHDEIGAVSDKIRSEMLEEMKTSLEERKKMYDKIPMNDTNIYYHYVGTITGILMRKGFWVIR